MVLNYKRLPYKTVWVDFADVQPLSKQISAPPTTTYSDGSPRYTLPTIHDPNTGRTVSDTFEIARYLDEQYPERKIFSKGSEDVQAQFANSAGSFNGTASAFASAGARTLMLEIGNQSFLHACLVGKPG